MARSLLALGPWLLPGRALGRVAGSRTLGHRSPPPRTLRVDIPPHSGEGLGKARASCKQALT
eukprot:1109348-Alexandrium_andersonii.AAC.1